MQVTAMQMLDMLSCRYVFDIYHVGFVMCFHVCMYLISTM